MKLPIILVMNSTQKFNKNINTFNPSLHIYLNPYFIKSVNANATKS